MSVYRNRMFARRFLARLARVSLGATGSLSPRLSQLIWSAGTPLPTMYALSTSARFRSTVSEVGSGISTTSYAGPRLAPPSVGGTTEDIFTNPQYGPVGDAIIPLLMMAIGYGAVLYRRKKAKELSLCD